MLCRHKSKYFNLTRPSQNTIYIYNKKNKKNNSKLINEVLSNAYL